MSYHFMKATMLCLREVALAIVHHIVRKNMPSGGRKVGACMLANCPEEISLLVSPERHPGGDLFMFALVYKTCLS